MISNTFGDKFKISLSGGSHEEKVSVSIMGVPPGIVLCADDFKEALVRRNPKGQAFTERKETDVPIFEKGLVPTLSDIAAKDSVIDNIATEGITTGNELVISFFNKNVRDEDYSKFADIPRPGHADFTSRIKYGKNFNGGGMFSGRMTVGIVAAGVVAMKCLQNAFSKMAEVTAINSIFNINAEISSVEQLNRTDFTDEESFDLAVAHLINLLKQEGDSAGGIITCIINGVPAGLGEPFFNSMESLLSHMIFSIPGVRGIEFGDGFKSSAMRGSEHNDSIVDRQGKTSKNGAGGINGGITNGNPIKFNVAFKPTSSISCIQKSYNFSKNKVESFMIKGRHDVCFALRCPIIVESAVAIVMANMADIL
ncbi:MAG: chorismate synthase [Bacteroidales bacterium]